MSPLEIFFEALLALLASIGLLGLGWLLLGRLLAPVGRSSRVLAVIPAAGDGEGLEQNIRGLLWLRCCGLAEVDVVIADCGLSEEGRRLAQILHQQEPGLVLCSAEQLADVTKGEEVSVWRPPAN